MAYFYVGGVITWTVFLLGLRICQLVRGVTLRDRRIASRDDKFMGRQQQAMSRYDEADAHRTEGELCKT